MKISKLVLKKSINYISAKNLLYEKSKSNIGLFYLKDPTTNEMSINTKQNLIVRSLEEYFALRAINVTGNSVNNYTVTLEIKKL